MSSETIECIDAKIMTQLGYLYDREILYFKVRTESNWVNEIPVGNWVAFIVADEPDKELFINAISKCLEKEVCYTCNAGQLAELGEDLFDEEIIVRAVSYENNTGLPYDLTKSPITTSHKNFSEGFWFAITSTHDDQSDINKVICLDFTSRGVRVYLTELVKKIDTGWLPTDEEYEAPFYDPSLA